ncbi:LysR family transcriptional regulator [Sandaracinobacteroides saxicola]|uniref:LysR family transcriptional regulator n=1 Tax=Sandaracinobacteroides saxicola TaxID=2759707 RepID=A0A7G5IJY0_9SPHN|nr:LysR family transcriptional regulator [Sandaracinobacteroides saxicola]QMW23672.1 LysR family transcriptional regulator [Sandaracinobacteroides saxicola]
MPFRRNVDIDLLRSFVTIVEQGSFTRAAQRLLRTQSAISLQMKRLEEQVGTDLFERGGRGVRPTQSGDMLLVYARRILAANDELVARIAEPDVAGEVSIAAPEDVTILHLNHILSRFTRAFPRVQLSVAPDLPGADITLTVSIGAAPEAVLWREPLVWAAVDELILRRNTVLQLVTGPEPCAYRATALAALNGAGIDARIAQLSPSLAGVQSALRAGLGVGLLPRSLAIDGIRPLPPEAGLPPLPDLALSLGLRPATGTVATRLADFIVSVMENA